MKFDATLLPDSIAGYSFLDLVLLVPSRTRMETEKGPLSTVYCLRSIACPLNSKHPAKSEGQLVPVNESCQVVSPLSMLVGSKAIFPVCSDTLSVLSIEHSIVIPFPPCTTVQLCIQSLLLNPPSCLPVSDVPAASQLLT